MLNRDFICESEETELNFCNYDTLRKCDEEYEEAPNDVSAEKEMNRMLCVQITQAAVRDSAKVRQNRTEMFQGSYYRVKTQHKQCKQVSGECTYMISFGQMKVLYLTKTS